MKELLKNKNAPIVLAIILACLFAILFGYGMFRKQTKEFYLKEAIVESNYNTNVKYFFLSYDDEMFQVSKQDYNLYKRHTGRKFYATKNNLQNKWEIMTEEEYFGENNASVIVWNKFSLPIINSNS